MIINIKNCIEELNEFIKTKSWFEEVPNKDVEPFKVVNQNIIFDRGYGQIKYLKSQAKKMNKLWVGKINDDQTRTEIGKKIKSFNRKLDRNLIKIIDNILKIHNINNIIFENIFGSVEYVRDKKNENRWLDKFPDLISY